jgi:hypothetical protein
MEPKSTDLTARLAYSMDKLDLRRERRRIYSLGRQMSVQVFWIIVCLLTLAAAIRSIKRKGRVRTWNPLPDDSDAESDISRRAIEQADRPAADSSKRSA